MAGQRAASAVPIAIEPGFYSNDTEVGPASLGRWIDGDRVRFVNGLPEKMKGWAQSALPAYRGIGRSHKQWASLDGQKWLAVGTHLRLYLYNQTTLYNITPIRRQITLTNPFTTTAGSALVTVTDTAHGANVGDLVTIENATAVGGLTLNGDFAVTAVIGPNSYRITAGSNAGSSVSGGGTPKITYEVNAGFADNGILTGFGTGDYGEEDYGTGMDISSTLTAPARVWSLDTWGEDLIASPNGGSIYWWDRTTGPFSRAQLLQNAPGNTNRVVVSPENRFVLALGANLLNNQFDKMLVKWPDQESLDNWTVTANGQAGSKRLDKGSELITGVVTTGGLGIWSDEHFYFAEYVGAPFYWDIRGRGTTTIAGPNAACDVDGTLYWMGQDKFYLFNGVVQEIPCDVWRKVFEDINRTRLNKVSCGTIASRNEIWWFYPATGATENNRYVVYNYLQRIWYTGTLSRTAFIDKGVFFGVPIGLTGDATSGTVWVHETGTDDGASPMNEYVESFGFTIQGGVDAFLLVNHLWPDFKRIAGTLSLQMRHRDSPMGAQTLAAADTITSATERIDRRVRASQVKMRLSSSALGTDWAMGVWRATATPHGRRG